MQRVNSALRQAMAFFQRLQIGLTHQLVNYGNLSARLDSTFLISKLIYSTAVATDGRTRTRKVGTE